MDFSLPTLFVVPTAGTLATGTSDTLTQGQIGVFLETGKVLGTAVNVVGKEFQIMQGRTPDEKIRLGSKKSGKISNATKMEWYKVAPRTGVNTTEIELSNFDFKCGEFYNFVMRFSSFYTNATHYDGYTDHIFFETPCCDCGTDPCETLTDEQMLAVLTEMVDKANAKWGTTYADFVLTGTTKADFLITITSKPLTSYQTFCTLFQPYLLDEMLMFPYLYRGPENSQDWMIESEKCKDDMVVTVTQRATYSAGKANDVKIMEYQNHSYQHDWKKLSYDMPELNQFYTSFVDGDNYTLYYVQYHNTSSKETWASYVHTDQMTIVAFPSGHAAMAGFEAILTAALGAPVSY